MVSPRIAVVSVHTSPLHQPGSGDAGGLNVYIAQTSIELARRGAEVDIFTRATAADQPSIVELAPAVRVHHIAAGPLRPLARGEHPAHLAAFAEGVLRAQQGQKPGYYDLIHSHYWLSGQVGQRLRDNWAIPLVHTAHTLAKVKNMALADGEIPELGSRLRAEERIAAEANGLIVNTQVEARQLAELYRADPKIVHIVPPGVDLTRFTPGSRTQARAELGLAEDSIVLAFAGRIQPHKGPDLFLRAAAELLRRKPRLAEKLVILIAGGQSGARSPWLLSELVTSLGLEAHTRLLPAQTGIDLVQFYRAADLVVVPSRSESFGLVALEAQASGTPVIASKVGGLPVVVVDGITGVLVPSRCPEDWADALALVEQPAKLLEWGANAARHAQDFSWSRTTDALLASYREAIRSFGLTARSGVAV